MFKNLDIHIIKIKEEIAKKDVFKRKVSNKMIEDLAERLGGNVF